MPRARRRTGARSSEFPEAKRLLGALANSRGHRHEENAARLVQAALAQPLPVGVALLASAEGYTPRANKLIDEAREQIAPLPEVAAALAENLPAPKAAPEQAPAAAAEEEGRRRGAGERRGAGRGRERRGAGRRRLPGGSGEAAPQPKPRRRRRRRSPQRVRTATARPAAEAEADAPAEPVQTDG